MNDENENREGSDTQERPSTINDNPNTVRPGGENEGVAEQDGGEGAVVPTGDDNTETAPANAGEGEGSESVA